MKCFATLMPHSAERAQRRRFRGQMFTLVELLIAMTVLTVMILVLMQFLLATQRLWKVNRTNIRIYENSRVAFEVIERDLRSSMTSTISDKMIGFWINDAFDSTDADDALICTFVSSVEHHEDANSRLCEISYKFHTETGVSSSSTTPSPFIFTRQMTCDNDTANWNFTGRPVNWYQNYTNPVTGFESVIDGVESVDFTFYDASDGVVIPDASGDLTIPYRVEVNLLLFDATVVNQPEAVRFKTRRSFTKIIFLGDLQTN